MHFDNYQRMRQEIHMYDDILASTKLADQDATYLSSQSKTNYAKPGLDLT